MTVITKSVLADEVKIAVQKSRKEERHNKRKADAMSMGEDAKVSVR